MTEDSRRADSECIIAPLEPGRLTVRATSWFATVADREGDEFPPGRRDTAPWSVQELPVHVHPGPVHPLEAAALVQ